MFTSRYLNNELKSIHERALRLIYIDYELPSERILVDHKQKSIYQKFQAGLTPPIMSDLFVTRENKYKFRNFQALESSYKQTV